MLKLPMHPRYSRMLVEAAKFGCVPAAALCAALVSGRDLLMRLGRDDKHIQEARELFEASQESDFYTLMRAYQFAKKNSFSVETCRRYGIHAQLAGNMGKQYGQADLQVGTGDNGAVNLAQGRETLELPLNSLLLLLGPGDVKRHIKDTGDFPLSVTQRRGGHTEIDRRSILSTAEYLHPGE